MLDGVPTAPSTMPRPKKMFQILRKMLILSLRQEMKVVLESYGHHLKLAEEILLATM